MPPKGRAFPLLRLSRLWIRPNDGVERLSYLVRFYPSLYESSSQSEVYVTHSYQFALSRSRAAIAETPRNVGQRDPSHFHPHGAEPFYCYRN